MIRRLSRGAKHQVQEAPNEGRVARMNGEIAYDDLQKTNGARCILCYTPGTVHMGR
jgi:hypothetical protein